MKILVLALCLVLTGCAVKQPIHIVRGHPRVGR